MSIIITKTVDIHAEITRDSEEVLKSKTLREQIDGTIAIIDKLWVNGLDLFPKAPHLYEKWLTLAQSVITNGDEVSKNPNMSSADREAIAQAKITITKKIDNAQRMILTLTHKT